MHLESLRVVHFLKDGSAAAPGEMELGRSSFMLDSCQRKLWVDSTDLGEFLPELAAPYRVYRGVHAYEFLLSVAAGLESQVVGETDIFGQFKQAWKEQGPRLPGELQSALSPWVQRLFEDTKLIRSQYLQNVGGSSYGSLLRKLLKDHHSLIEGPTVLIGAGQLAHSVAPYLTEHELLIANRSADRANGLARELQSQFSQARIRVLENFEEELAALPSAAQVIVCVPLDEERDPFRIEALRLSSSHVVHLGAREGQPSHWPEVPGFHSLDEIFRIEKSADAIRSLQVEKARGACREKALLRLLGGGSTSIAHGWEDLAAFG